MQPEGRGPNLLVLLFIAVATFLLPMIQRWLRIRAQRAGTRPRELEGEPEGFDPFREPRPDEPEARGSRPPTSPEEAIADKLEPAKIVPKDSTPAEVTPLLPPRPALPSAPASSLEERLFANRRWSPGARLILAKELLARPRCFRRAS